jgi:putative transcriptional regulator
MEHRVAYKEIEIDRQNLTIMGVRFPDLDALNSAANAIGSNMFEGFEPTSKSIELIRDYLSEKVTLGQLVQLTKEKAYA